MASKTLGPGDAYSFRFYTRSTAGAPTDADSLPTAAAFRNGTADAWATRVTKLSTGRYRVTGTIPVGYAVGDAVEVEITAVVGGVTGYRVDEFRLDVLTNSRNAVAPDNATIALIYGVVDTEEGTILSNVAAIKTQTDKLTFTGSNVNSAAQSVPNVTVAGYAAGQSPASLILATPANKLTTDGSGFVTAANGGSGSAPSVEDIATRLLTNPANKIVVDGSGNVQVSKTGFALTAAYDPAKTAAQAGSAMTLTTDERASIAAAVFGFVTETGYTFLQTWRLLCSALLGKSSDGGSIFRDLNDTKPRVTATVDVDGNRTQVTRDGG